MAFKRHFVFPSVGIPQSDSIVPTPASESFSILAEDNTINRTSVPYERLLLSSRDGIPQADTMVPASTGERTPVLAIGDASNPMRMSGKDLLGVPRNRIP